MIPATAELVRAALDGTGALGSGLRASVPPTWPPEYLDTAAFQFTLERLQEGPGQEGWWLYFVVLPGAAGGRALIGSAGYKGPPSADGTVEVGYGIVSDHRRRGYATEAARGLIDHAFSLPAVRRVIAETLPDLIPSIGVLRRCGFRPAGDAAEGSVLRFEITRSEYAALKGDL